MPDLPQIPSWGLMQQIRKMLRGWMGEERLPIHRYPQVYGPRIRRHQGILLNDVSASANPLTAPVYGTVRVVKNDGTGTLVVTNLCLTVAYRFTLPNLESGSFCKIEFIDGEWSFYAVDCEDSGLPTTGCS